MTSKQAITEAIKTVEFDKNFSVQTNDRESFEGYAEVLKKLEEAMELMKKHNLI